MKYISLLVFLMMSCSRTPRAEKPATYHCAYPFGPSIQTPNPNVTMTRDYIVIDGENNTVYVPKAACIAVVEK